MLQNAMLNVEQIENPGDWVEDRCRELGVSVYRVCREARVHRSTVSKWKHEHHRPYWDNLERIKRAFDRIGEQKKGA